MDSQKVSQSFLTCYSEHCEESPAKGENLRCAQGDMIGRSFCPPMWSGFVVRDTCTLWTFCEFVNLDKLAKSQAPGAFYSSLGRRSRIGGFNFGKALKGRTISKNIPPLQGIGSVPQPTWGVAPGCYNDGPLALGCLDNSICRITTIDGGLLHLRRH